MVSVAKISYASCKLWPELYALDVPLDSPLHGSVCDNHRWEDVEDLSADTSGDVEESGVESTSEWTLGVGGKTVVDDTSLLWGSWILGQPLVPALEARSAVRLLRRLPRV